MYGVTYEERAQIAEAKVERLTDERDTLTAELKESHLLVEENVILTAERDTLRTFAQQQYQAGRESTREEAVAIADRAANDYHDLGNTQAENAADRISTELAKLP